MIFYIFTSIIIKTMNTRFLLILLFAVGFTSLCVALPPPPPSGNTPDCWPPPCIPIDGGISLLIAAGAIYCGRKLYKNQQEKNAL
jgi:hypothetical protein